MISTDYSTTLLDTQRLLNTAQNLADTAEMLLRHKAFVPANIDPSILNDDDSMPDDDQYVLQGDDAAVCAAQENSRGLKKVHACDSEKPTPDSDNYYEYNPQHTNRRYKPLERARTFVETIPRYLVDIANERYPVRKLGYEELRHNLHWVIRQLWLTSRAVLRAMAKSESTGRLRRDVRFVRSALVIIRNNLDELESAVEEGCSN